MTAGTNLLENESGTLIEVPQEVKEHIAYAAGGDVRKALNFCGAFGAVRSTEGRQTGNNAGERNVAHAKKHIQI